MQIKSEKYTRAAPKLSVENECKKINIMDHYDPPSITCSKKSFVSLTVAFNVPRVVICTVEVYLRAHTIHSILQRLLVQLLH